jgi:hypothetical protein
MIHSVFIKSEAQDRQAFEDLAQDLDTLPDSGYSFGAYGMQCAVADSDTKAFKNILIKKGITEHQKKYALFVAAS